MSGQCQSHHDIELVRFLNSREEGEESAVFVGIQLIIKEEYNPT